MTAMISGVNERTKEIGIKKSIGATKQARKTAKEKRADNSATVALQKDVSKLIRS